jgi:parallel beta-helix repeat protein
VAFLGDSAGVMEGCDLQNHALPELVIGGRAAPEVKDCKIHKSLHMGVWITDQARPTLTGCRVLSAARVGVGISGASPTLTDCRISGNTTNGLTIYDGAKPTLKSCEISRNGAPDVVIWGEADPTLTGCQIVSGKTVGVWVRVGGKGTLTDCEISRSKLVGLQVDDGTPVLRGCTLQKLPVAARYTGSGGGLLADCVLADNEQGVIIVDGPGPQVTPAPAAVEE